MTNDELAALILPWAKEHLPDAYAQTVVPGVVQHAKTFRRYLTRLVELRHAREPRFARTVPVSVLDETALVVKLRPRQGGPEIEVKGRLAPRPHVWRFKELAMIETPEQLAGWLAMKDELELEIVDE